MEPRISLITLGVRDLDRARRFYVDGLGLPVQPESQAEIVFLGLGAIWLALHPRDMLAADAETTADGSGFRGFTLAHNVRTRAEVDAVLAQAVRAGGRLVRPAHEASWGGYTGYFADPDDFLWEVAHNPHFWIG